MKNTLRIMAACMALVCCFSVFGAVAFADGLQSGKEMFADVSEEDVENLSGYEQLMYKAFLFDEELLLPAETDTYSGDNIRVKMVQGKYGMARGQELYAGPEAGDEADWFVRDSCRVKVLAESGDFSFVELLYLEGSEGTFAWIPSKYLADEWSLSTSYDRTCLYGGLSF